MKSLKSAPVMAILLMLLIAVPVYAGSFGVSPSQVEIQVPAQGKASVEFKFYDFTGDVRISIENIPLRISPVSASVSPENDKIILTFYGDGGTISQTYEGKILFLAMSNSEVNTGIKVKARVVSIANDGLQDKYSLIIGLTVAGAFIVGGSIFVIRKRGRFAV